MKAKEYADKFMANPTIPVLTEICNSFINELSTMVVMRNIKTDDALISVFKELDDKWRAFSERTKGIVRRDGFRILVKEQYPKVYFFLGWDEKAN